MSELLPRFTVDEEKKLCFKQRKSVVVKDFLPAELIRLLQSVLPNVKYYQHEYLIGDEASVQEFVGKPKFMNVMLELMNDPSVIAAVEQLTGHNGLSNFKGRHYRLDSTVKGIEWHHDLDNHKKVAVSINISNGIFTGGELLIRHKITGDLQKFHNSGLGDAVLFEVHEDYEHCVLPVTGDVPKLVITGWYHQDPSRSRP
jgi:Rps23 Pro-64 3,4-dihydroxylase Tpa1-like proline 4-hydroxylase